VRENHCLGAAIASCGEHFENAAAVGSPEAVAGRGHGEQKQSVCRNEPLMVCRNADSEFR
jgi:hypothetical protein